MSANIDKSIPVGTGLALGDLVASGVAVEIPAAPVADATPTKKKPGRPKKTAAGGVNGDVAAEPATPKTPAKRGRKPKTPVVTTNEDGEVIPSAAKSTTKRGAAKAADGETPSKKPRATPAKVAATKTGFPTCWEEFTEEDKLIVNMRRNKANWCDIEAEWEKLSGKKPGTDVLRKKFAKLDAVATVFAPGDSAKLAHAKTTVEAAIEEQIKKFKADKWTRVADQMKADGAGTYKAATIEKKYEHMVNNNLIDATGAYIGPDESVPAANGDGHISGVEAAAEAKDSEMADAEDASDDA